MPVINPGSSSVPSAIPADVSRLGLVSLSFQPSSPAGGSNITAGLAYVMRLPTYVVGQAFTKFVHVIGPTAGSGTAAANHFLAVYTKAGVLVAKSSDQAAVTTVAGSKYSTLTAEAGQSLVMQDDYMWGFIVLGTQNGTTAAQMPRGYANSSSFVSFGLESPEILGGTFGAGLTAPPATFDPLTIAVGNGILMGLK